MSTAVMSNPIFECGDFFKNTGMGNGKSKQNTAVVTESISQTGQFNGGGLAGNDHTPLRRSYTSFVNLIEQHRKLDRSVSEPTSRYKTELCRPFEESGTCKYGDKCQFAHGYAELRNLTRHPKYKTELCRTFHKIGFCPYGPRCHFVHNFEEARIHNLKVSTQLAHPATDFGPLLQPATTAAIGVNVSLLEQLTSSSQVTAAVVRTGTLNQHQQQHPYQRHHFPLQRTNSFAVSIHSEQQHQQCPRPKPLNLSPTFSLGSAADSISPSSSLSQSPTNSMASFFTDELNTVATTVMGPTLPTSAPSFGFAQELALLSTRHSPSPQTSLLDDFPRRTPSPLSTSGESRLPVFNRISSTLSDLDALKI